MPGAQTPRHFFESASSARTSRRRAVLRAVIPGPIFTTSNVHRSTNRRMGLQLAVHDAMHDDKVLGRAY